jgi:hypothetical protein
MFQPYKELANAIVIQACKDLRYGIQNRNNPDTKIRRKAKRLEAETRTFFNGDLYNQLSNTPGEKVVRYIERKCENEN